MKHLLLTLFLAHRGLLMGRIKKKQTIIHSWKSNGKRSNGKIFCFQNKFLNFSGTKKFSTESFLTFRELQPLVSYKRVSYKKIRVFHLRGSEFDFDLKHSDKKYIYLTIKILHIIYCVVKVIYKWIQRKGNILLRKRKTVSYELLLLSN